MMNAPGQLNYLPGPPPFPIAAMPAPPYASGAIRYPVHAPAASNPAVPMHSAPVAYYPGAPIRALPPPPPPPPFRVPVHAVWADNIDAVRRHMGYFAAHAVCVAVKVHYPGVIHHQDDGVAALTTPEKRYAVVKANVDALKPLQLGLAICTDDGRVAAWEFNLSDFDPAVDAHAAHSLLHLQSRGLDVHQHRQRGIPMEELGKLLRFSGLLSNRPGVSWITHTGAYPLAYLMKVLDGGKQQLRGDMAGFLDAVRRSLGEEVYDVATMAADRPDMPVGLEYIAGRLGVAPPLATNLLAGAGSVLALQAFINLRSQVFRGDMTRYRGVLQGLHTI
ncbi:hypothetical protein HU200_041933 [Digitaria exilis]|uniref:Uncharacterized protein n=1 Tax=Digitaria exilis TaxID=1010633 RepID=A0A835B620_9POAL|nr:hypothetical protein HU200_041933 [Digitaria exilis]